MILCFGQLNVFLSCIRTLQLQLFFSVPCYRVALPFPLHFNKELLSVTATLSYSLDC